MAAPSLFLLGELLVANGNGGGGWGLVINSESLGKWRTWVARGNNACVRPSTGECPCTMPWTRPFFIVR